MHRSVTTLVILCIVACGSVAGVARAQVAPYDSADPDPFAKSYVSIEVARNYPTSFTQNHFKAGQYHPTLGYRHNLDGTWLMGVGAQFKIFRRKNEAGEEQESRDLALWTMTHEALKVVRLDHPTYLLVGPKIHYLLPSQAARFPLAREGILPMEIGVAASMTLARLLDSGALVTIRADRWRGTRTMKLHGIEIAVGYSRPLR